MDDKNEISPLPLSWLWDNNSRQISSVNLLFPSQKWIYTARINFEKYKEYISSVVNKKIIIRGCGAEVSSFLEKNNFDKIIFGKEAVLEYSKDHFTKKSIRELIKRGFRHGEVFEIKRTEESIERLAKLRKSSAHSDEPQLKHLFVTGYISGTRLFVFVSHEGEWLGAILLSENNPDKFHTELLLRKKSAPIGIMEALVYEVFKQTEKDGKEELSLGEVPFVVKIPISKKFYRDFILNRIAKFFRFAYNYEGLYNFKNKFNPRWEELFICGYPKLKLSHIVGIIIKSNLVKLILYKLFK